MRGACLSRHLYGLFICICVICLLPVFPLAANGATLADLAGNALATVSLTAPPLGWTATRSLITARYYHTATLLPSGSVLVAGGYNGDVLSSCEIYDSSDTAPGAPTGVSATAGNAQATVSFPPPALNGGNAITGYTVTSNPGGITATGAGSPITVKGLTNGTAYTFTVTATNKAGTGTASSSSNSVTPQ